MVYSGEIAYDFYYQWLKQKKTYFIIRLRLWTFNTPDTIWKAIRSKSFNIVEMMKCRIHKPKV